MSKDNNAKELTLQAGKTYVTNDGEVTTVKEYKSSDETFYRFEGSNGFVYGTNGKIFEYCDSEEDIVHELPSVVSHRNGNSSDNSLENLNFVSPEENLQPKIIDVLKFKQRTKYTKRKLTFTDYSDGTVNLKFKTKTKGQDVLIGGIRLSYEALDLLYEALRELKSQDIDERTYH